jgi:TetR/AcrR family transcriptional regulator
MRRSARSSAARTDSRARILAAAAAEFSTHGFDGANMDRLARAAGLNKAMIYYHFRSKAALYGEIFREFLGLLLARVRAVAATEAAPDDKIRGFIRAIADGLLERPHAPAIWLREVAGGAPRVDRATLDLLAAVPATLGRIVEEGCHAGTFSPAHPLLLHFGIVGPLVLFQASHPVRARLNAPGHLHLAALELDDMLAHIERATLAALAPGPRGASAPAAVRRRPRRTAATTSSRHQGSRP